MKDNIKKYSILIDNYTPVDARKDFNNWFDTIYAFEKLPFIDMSPSEVLFNMDIKEYYKLFLEWVSEEDLIFMYDKYWNKSDVEEVFHLTRVVKFC